MPSGAKKPCAKFPACTKLAEPGSKHCAKHQQHDVGRFRTAETAKQTTTQRGYGYDWQKKRKHILIRDPFCMIAVVCVTEFGAQKPSSCVDHIVPIEVAPDRRLDDDNLQGACDACNKWKNDNYDKKNIRYIPGKSNQPSGVTGGESKNQNSSRLSA